MKLKIIALKVDKFMLGLTSNSTKTRTEIFELNIPDDVYDNMINNVDTLDTFYNIVTNKLNQLETSNYYYVFTGWELNNTNALTWKQIDTQTILNNQ